MAGLGFLDPTSLLMTAPERCPSIPNNALSFLDQRSTSFDTHQTGMLFALAIRMNSITPGTRECLDRYSSSTVGSNPTALQNSSGPMTPRLASI